MVENGLIRCLWRKASERLDTYIGTYSDYRADPGTTPKPGPGLPPHAQNHTFRETPPPPLTRNTARRAHRLLARPAIARTEVLGVGPWGPNGIGHAALNWA